MREPSFDEGPIDFKDEADQPKVRKATVVRPSEAPGVLSYRAPGLDKPPMADAEEIKDRYLPVGVLIGGVAIELLVAAIWPRRASQPLLEMVTDLTFGTALLMLAMWIASRLRHIDLGRPRDALLKLAAISIGPAAMLQFAWPILVILPLGIIVGFTAEFVLFFALLGAMFDLDEADTWFCVMLIFIVRVASYVALGRLFGRG
jgi:hypothetical protein